MKILVPTDFSSFSNAALSVAAQLAEVFHAEISIYHNTKFANELNSHFSTNKQDSSNPEVIDIANLMSQALHSVNQKKTMAEYKFASGKLVQSIEHLVTREKFDLVVIGSHGVSGKKEIFIGSNAQKIIRSLRLPVLIIKEPIKKISFKKVLFASGFNSSERKSFEHLLRIVHPFNPEMHLLAINTSSFFMQPSIILFEAMEKFAELAFPLSVKKHFYSDISVEAGIRHFSEDLDIDMIAISNHERHPLKRMFQGSNVEMLVNHSNIPVLTLDHE